MVTRAADRGRSTRAGDVQDPRSGAWEAAATTPDPELPLLTIADLGILRDVQADGDHVVATITPTYSGCPALREISADLRARLEGAGFCDVEVRLQLAPAWTTDWITDAGHDKLRAAGITPPGPAPARSTTTPLTLGPRPAVTCPRCGSGDTRSVADFGATACRSLHRCLHCAEPFEAVKPL